MSTTLLALLLVALALFGVYLAQVKVYHGLASATDTGIRSIPAKAAAVAQKISLGEVLLDSILIVVAYLGAYLLKFESNIYGPFLTEFARSVPYVLALKLAVFLLTDTYKGGWRWAGLPEVVSLGKASTLASLASVIAVAVIWRFDDYSKSVFVIDWLLFTWLVIGSRMSFRLLGHWVSDLSGVKNGRLLVVGTPDRGANIVRAIRQGIFGECVPVGFVGLEEAAALREVAGVAVLGSRAQLGDLLDDLRVDGVVIAIDSGADLAGDVLEECSKRGIPCQEIRPLQSSNSAEAPAKPEGSTVGSALRN